jgi:4-hydroxy-3-methylbut-2-en-1-yl diphosphate synthase IspG/GcpE
MTEIAPAAHPSCPTCDGVRVEVGVRTDIEQQEIKLCRPTRRGWGVRDIAAVRALACAGCGLVTFHVTDLANLQAEVTKHPEFVQVAGLMGSCFLRQNRRSM